MASVDIAGIFRHISDLHRRLGIFKHVTTHEPKSAPEGGLTASIWGQYLGPQQTASGLISTSALLVYTSRIYVNFLQKPEDDIDPRIFAATVMVMNALHADLDLGGSVRNIDVLGASGRRLEANSGFIPQDSRVYRVTDITIPLIVNDVFDQEFQP